MYGSTTKQRVLSLHDGCVAWQNHAPACLVVQVQNGSTVVYDVADLSTELAVPLATEDDASYEALQALIEEVTRRAFQTSDVVGGSDWECMRVHTDIWVNLYVH